ncbi:hypothetical protein AC579_8268 [Pseudocercospora musae]|uniref:Uncharacterized protein n=1 Tax=Pseudocercospora musae TaxID=113226 RepID=A0A139IVK4_9PEZI|nr:hypothetical protein AC579_8268 [Pseudocercospora musae]
MDQRCTSLAPSLQVAAPKDRRGLIRGHPKSLSPSPSHDTLITTLHSAHAIPRAHAHACAVLCCAAVLVLSCARTTRAPRARETLLRPAPLGDRDYRDSHIASSVLRCAASSYDSGTPGPGPRWT